MYMIIELVDVCEKRLSGKEGDLKSCHKNTSVDVVQREIIGLCLFTATYGDKSLKD